MKKTDKSLCNCFAEKKTASVKKKTVAAQKPAEISHYDKYLSDRMWYSEPTGRSRRSSRDYG